MNIIEKIRKKLKDRPIEKNRAIRNNFYMLRLIWKASKFKVIGQFGALTFLHFFYDVIYSVWFIRSAVDVLERGGTFKEFLRVVLILTILKTSADLLEYWFYSYKNEILNIRVQAYLNKLLFDKAIEIELSRYENTEFYNVYKRATEVLTSSKFKDCIFNISCTLAAFVTGVTLAVYIISLDPKLILLMSCLLFALLFSQIENKIEYKKDKESTNYKRQKEYVRRTVFLKDFAKEMKTSSIYEVLQIRYKNSVESIIGIIKKYGYKKAILAMLVEFSSGLFPISVGYIYCSYRLVVMKDLSITDFSVLVVALMKLKTNISSMSNFFSRAHEQSLYIQNFKDFLEYEPVMSGEGDIPPEFKSLEFKNVSFKYESGTENVLKNVSFSINKGEKIAIVGHNGAGKSSLAKLMLRLYDSSEGEILWNGVNIKNLDLNEYRNRFATVFQDYCVYSLPVTENVLMREYESNDRDNVISSLKKSGAYDKAVSLRNGIDTTLTREFDESGSVLSGGESQKVCISRLFAQDFAVALLDEPSSALDPIAEYKVYESLIEHTKDKTVIYISHRLSSATLSDKVLMFEDGILVECGTHQELMSEGGKYAQMFTLQASNYKTDYSEEVDAI